MLHNTVAVVRGCDNDNGGLAQLASVLGERAEEELEGSALLADAVGAHMARDAEHGRLLRLVVRFNLVLERPPGDLGAQWAETGAVSQNSSSQQLLLIGNHEPSC